MIISVEGPDGSGKSSLCRWLKKKLEKEGFEVELFREPGSTRLGDKIREILLHSREVEIKPCSEFFLFMAARMQLLEEKVFPALNSGKIVLLDRFIDSTLVYQGICGGLDYKILLDVMRKFIPKEFPTVTILLNCDVDTLIGRITGGDKIETRGRDFLEKIVSAYGKLRNIFPERMICVDASVELDKMYEDVWKRLREKL